MKTRTILIFSSTCLALALTAIIVSITVLVPAMQNAASGSGNMSAADAAKLTVPDMLVGAGIDTFSFVNTAVNTAPVSAVYMQMRALDWFVPLVYGGFLAFLLWLLPSRTRYWLLVPAIAAVLCDYIENIILVSVTGAPAPGLFPLIRFLGVGKFAFFGAGLVGFLIGLAAKVRATTNAH